MTETTEEGLTIKTNKGMGWRPDIPDFRDLEFSDPDFKAARAGAVVDEQLLAAPLPSALLIPSSRLPKVFDQGGLGSCVGNAISTMMTYVRKLTPRSRLFIYYEARRLINETVRDEGCYIRDGIKVIANLGAPRESLWPYRESKVFVDPDWRADRDAAARKIVKYARLNGRDDFKRCIAEGYPFVIGFSVYDGFSNGRGQSTEIQLLPEAGQALTGGHAVCVIGYNDNFRETTWAKDNVRRGFPADRVPEKVYYVRNSWGTRWGRKGDFAIDARYFENPNLAADAWTIRNR